MTITIDQMNAWAETLETALRVGTLHEKQRTPHPQPKISITLERGSRYTRIVVSDGPHNRSAYGFINNETGDLFKSASWKAPAKHRRGNILGTNPLSGCSFYGMEYMR